MVGLVCLHQFPMGFKVFHMCAYFFVSQMGLGEKLVI